MAEIVFRANLKTSTIPLLSELHGRSVIVRNQDQNYVPYVADKESLDTSMGIAQIYYCHNVVPTNEGYKSVGYTEYTSAVYPENTGFQQPVSIRDGEGNYARLAVTEAGGLYVMPLGSTVWEAPMGAPAPSTIAGKRISAAFVSGTTYIYFQGVGCYKYVWSTNTIEVVTLSGVTASEILGIVGDSGYLLAYSPTDVIWSSTTDPTDFVSSVTTGAGGGQVESARGAIVTVEPVYGGLVVFTSRNAVAAIYSNNPRYPYNFVEITGCGGLVDPEYVSYDANSGALHAYTTSGLQTVTLKKATSIFPEITDFLSGDIFEDFDTTSLELVRTDVSGSEMKKRVAVIADRYIIISYGIGKLTHAIFIDSALKQIGKLRIEHTACFEFQQYTSAAIEVPKKSCAFLSSGGAVHVLNFDTGGSASDGVAILGKYQYVRARLLTLQAAEVESVEPTASLAVYAIPSYDGKTLEAPVAGYEMPRASIAYAREYKFCHTGKNVSLLLQGAFSLVSLVLTFTVHGAR